MNQVIKAKPVSILAKPRHRAFIEAYTNFGNRKTCGNATQSYLAAFPDVAYNTAMTHSMRLLRREDVQEAIQTVLADRGFNDIVADRELLRVMTQNKDLSPKVTAIKEYNKLKKRVSEGGTNINIGFSLGDLFERAANVKDQVKRDVIDIDLSAV
jgi:hypothetical protein